MVDLETNSNLNISYRNSAGDSSVNEMYNNTIDAGGKGRLFDLYR
jgi:hypothetical protein